MNELYRRSIEIILKHQAPSGAYIASPNFQTYAYSWFRDGSYIAYSMDLAGEHASARSFHAWAAGVIDRYRGVIEYVVENSEAAEKEYLHTRYTLDGVAVKDDWPNNQTDGFGTWLWSLNQHRILSGEEIPEDWLRSARLVAGYLAATWKYPCSDSWEEFHDRIHTYTLASIYAGIEAYQELSDQDQSDLLRPILDVIQTQMVVNNHYVKYIGSEMVDANLISLAVPYGLVESDDPLIQSTIQKIEEDLVRDRGVHRYIDDTYYGGGEWILLSAWLGWYWAERGDINRARGILLWIESQANDQGELPEQVPENLNQPDSYQVWFDRWGEIARPLLWSHAKYIILYQSLQD